MFKSSLVWGYGLKHQGTTIALLAFFCATQLATTSTKTAGSNLRAITQHDRLSMHPVSHMPTHTNLILVSCATLLQYVTANR